MTWGIRNLLSRSYTPGAKKVASYDERMTGSMADRIVLVTGATSGIGLETARQLAALGARVIVGARNPDKGRAVADEIVRAGGHAEALTVDFASLESVRFAARELGERLPRLDVLVNNAGTAVARRETTADGYERTWQTNYLGHYLLTRLLLPLLKKSASPRIVNVSSEGHRQGRLDWDDLELSRGYGGFRAYANTKLAQVLFTRELARREPAVTTVALHPGAIGTNIWKALPAHADALLRLILPGAAHGARPVARLASDPALTLESSGLYFKRFRESTPAPPGRTDADAERLWLVSERATGFG
jgi:NAD(P)-dependent dehydrogenase (short-subunit alcohol dehydrogenase family)